MQAFVRLSGSFFWVVLSESAWNIPIITRRRPATLKASMMMWLKMTEPERVVPPNIPEKSANWSRLMMNSLSAVAKRIARARLWRR